MKTYSTNYRNTLIEPAEDCPTLCAQMPPARSQKKTLAELQYEMLINKPYQFTSDEVLFTTFAKHKEIPEIQMEEAREAWFAKGQPCFRSSALTKRYGWAIHFDAEMKMALIARESDKFAQLAADKSLIHTKALRTKRI